jgi:hypothetical protein
LEQVSDTTGVRPSAARVGFRDNTGITSPITSRVALFTYGKVQAYGNHAFFISVLFKGDASPSAEMW